MEVVFERCTGIDVHKRSVAACSPSQLPPAVSVVWRQYTVPATANAAVPPSQGVVRSCTASRCDLGRLAHRQNLPDGRHWQA